MRLAKRLRRFVRKMLDSFDSAACHGCDSLAVRHVVLDNDRITCFYCANCWTNSCASYDIGCDVRTTVTSIEQMIDRHTASRGCRAGQLRIRAGRPLRAQVTARNAR
jgi:hypothetical protein